MTLLKEKLEAAIAEWEEPKGKQLFKTTNNVTRSTFNAVRDNPGCTRKVILALLETKGFKLASTTSILSQMLKQRLVREEDDGTLHANFKEYTPLKAGMRNQPKVVKKVKVEAPRTAIITTNFDVNNIIKNLTIYQAKDLRDALNNLFK
jgi:hypothetical protein